MLTWFKKYKNSKTVTKLFPIPITKPTFRSDFRYYLIKLSQNDLIVT